MAAVPEVADEPLWAARVCFGRPAAAFVPAGADSLLGAGSADDVAAPTDDVSDVAVDVVPDDAEVAVSDDFSDAAEPADFADEDPAGDEDPPVSAHAIPAPPNSAAPTPRAMARPPTRPMEADARSARLRLVCPPSLWRLVNVSGSAAVLRVSTPAPPSGCVDRSLCEWAR